MMNIIEGVQMLDRHCSRRLPITYPGNEKPIGIVIITNVINMIGGGSRYNSVTNRHKGSLQSTLNDEIRELTSEKDYYFFPLISIREAICLLIKNGHGSSPITNPDNTLAGIVTKYDIMKVFAGTKSELFVDEIMMKNPKVVTPDVHICCVIKQMVDQDYRQLPNMKDGFLIDMITTTNIRGYLGRCLVFSKKKTRSLDETLCLSVRAHMIAADIKTMSPNKKINDAAWEMLEFSTSSFPVIDEGRFTGIVTEFDLVKGLTKNI
ncbi:MAG: CBS domain-containing protein [Methanocalculaceae archaeon]|jgi:CBS domain-containing protein|nr:CBS domain-containing protein [Methanocalculaceae archaeon]